jgi:hypothetical protein
MSRRLEAGAPLDPHGAALGADAAAGHLQGLLDVSARLVRAPALPEAEACKMCTCGHSRAMHGPKLPAPCDADRTMTDEELIARCCDPHLTEDPRYGCTCMGFSPLRDATGGGR